MFKITKFYQIQDMLFEFLQADTLYKYKEKMLKSLKVAIKFFWFFNNFLKNTKKKNKIELAIFSK